MSRALITGGVVLLLALTGPLRADELDLAGKWISEDYQTVVALAPCPGSSTAICAMILEQTRPDGERSRVGELIGVDFVRQNDGRWAGQVVGVSGARLPATLTMPQPNRFDMRVCIMGIVCDGASYFRAKP